jgi:hypothetical protein
MLQQELCGISHTLVMSNAVPMYILMPTACEIDHNYRHYLIFRRRFVTILTDFLQNRV